MRTIMCRHGLLPALACLALLMSVPALSGQPPRREAGSNPSHILLPKGITDPDEAETVLTQRLQRYRDLSAIQDLLKKMGVEPKDFLSKDFAKDPKNVEWAAKLAKQFGQARLNPNDPKLQKLIGKVRISGKLNADQLETIRRVIPESLGPQAPSATDPKSSDPAPMGQPPKNQEPQPPKPPKPPEEKPKSADSSSTPDETDSSDEKSSTFSSMPELPARRGERSGLFSGWLGAVRGDRGLAGKMRNTMKGLFGPGSGLGKYTRGLTNDLRARLPGFSGLSLGKISRGFGKVPDALKFRPRNEDSASVDLPDYAIGFSTVLLVGVVLGVAGVLVWVMVVRPRWAGWGGKDGWRLGAWPVQPSAVRTRGDVVKAFEYLALLLLGRKVSTSHHLDIAGQLGTSQNDLTGRRKNAAEELAQLYEHARYAPPSEQLSEDELATARRDLSFLAGGAVA